MQEGFRFAAIDVGSNAMRLFFCRVLENGEGPTFIKESMIRMPLRLGHDAFTENKISDETCDKFVNTMYGFNSLMQAYEPISFKACATEAMRQASNGLDLVDRVKEETGISLNIITGKEEANIIISTHIDRYLQTDQHCLYVDVGGGSTELTLIKNKETLFSKSFSIGSVRLLEEQVSADDWSAMKEWIVDKTSTITNIQSIGSGGNINKILTLLEKSKGKSVSFKEIKSIIKKIKPFSIHDRIVKLGLRPDRADVIVHAGKIYSKCMKWSGANNMIVPQVGLADGMISQLYDDFK
ncbi:MAG: exopolyphosphatase [Candidatus Neomarinimicrobiota bacterium]|nr:exopolyphosphatase [Candidatus Neomarinimicrobiota bacterium]|tara:strand:+ start:524 stop:1411 length:888 start_codon:yes stop_codon:yes gene_type:complete